MRINIFISFVILLVLGCLVLSSLQLNFGGTNSDLRSRKCHWIGNAPFCGKLECSIGWQQVDRNKNGDGHRCLTGKKVFCCENTLPAVIIPSTSTTTRRPYIRPSTSTKTYPPRPSPRPTPTTTPMNGPTTDDFYGYGGGGRSSSSNDHWKGKNVIPIPITREKSSDVTPPVTPTRPTTTTTSRSRTRQEDILALLNSLDDLP